MVFVYISVIFCSMRVLLYVFRKIVLFALAVNIESDFTKRMAWFTNNRVK